MHTHAQSQLNSSSLATGVIPRSEIEQEIIDLDNAITMVEERTGNLNHRLSPVIRQVPGKAEQANNPPEAPLSPLADSIRTLRRRIVRIAGIQLEVADSLAL